MQLVGIVGWPQLLPGLVQLLDHQSPAVVEGAFYALEQICEQHYETYVCYTVCESVRIAYSRPPLYSIESDQTTQPLNIMIPKFLSLLSSPVPKLRRHALQCLNQFIMLKPAALMVHMQQFLQVRCYGC